MFFCVQLSGEAQGHVADALVVERLLAGGREGVAQEVVGRPSAERAEEPQAVTHDRPAEGGVEIVDRVDAVLHG